MSDHSDDGEEKYVHQDTPQLDNSKYPKTIQELSDEFFSDSRSKSGHSENIRSEKFIPGSPQVFQQITFNVNRSLSYNTNS